MRGGYRWRVAWATVVALGMAANPPADAAVMTDNYEVSSRVESQNTFHHDAVDNFDWVQWRNKLRFDLRYRLIPRGKDFLFIDDAMFSMLYRARYDAAYDILERFKKRGYDRDDFSFPEGKYPREIFLDLEFGGALEGLSTRIGRQQVVWGEADLFRSLDVVNPLRLDQTGIIGEDLDDYREPLWIAKFLYSIGNLPGLSRSVLEFFYSPNGRPLTDRILVSEAFRIGVDRNNALGGPFLRPTASPFQRVRHPWEVTRVGQEGTDAPDYADLGSDATTCADGLGCADFVYLIDNQIPTSVVDPDASMFGTRLMGQTIFGIDLTLNYLFKRTEVPGTALRITDLFDPNIADDGSPNPRADLVLDAALAAATPDADGNGIPDGTDDLVRRCVHEKEPVYIVGALHGSRNLDTLTGENLLTGCELVQFWYPWTHVIGTTATYNDFKYTGFIWRFEGSLSTKEPRNAAAPLAGPRAGNFPTRRDFDTHLKRTTQVYRTMLGFDYLRTIYPYPPKWIRHMWVSTFLKDQWFFTFQWLNEYYTHVNGQMGLLDSPSDRMQHHNSVFTLVMTGFFDHEKLRPWIALGYDVNADFPLAWLQFEYYFTPNLSVRMGEILYMGSKNAESFLFLHRYADRDNFFVRFTYFLI